MSVVNNLPDKVDSIFGMLLTVWLRVKPVGMRFTMSRVGVLTVKDDGDEPNYSGRHGATHSFRLHPRACHIIDNHPEVIPNSKTKNKSLWVSKAIEWFFDSAVLGRERNEEGEFTGKWVPSTHGRSTPIALMLEIDKLKEELEQITSSRQVAKDEAEKVPEVRGLKALFHRIRSFTL